MAARVIRINAQKVKRGERMTGGRGYRLIRWAFGDATSPSKGDRPRIRKASRARAPVTRVCLADAGRLK